MGDVQLQPCLTSWSIHHCVASRLDLCITHQLLQGCMMQPTTSCTAMPCASPRCGHTSGTQWWQGSTGAAALQGTAAALRAASRPQSAHHLHYTLIDPCLRTMPPRRCSCLWRQSTGRSGAARDSKYPTQYRHTCSGHAGEAGAAAAGVLAEAGVGQLLRQAWRGAQVPPGYAAGRARPQHRSVVEPCDRLGLQLHDASPA